MNFLRTYSKINLIFLILAFYIPTIYSMKTKNPIQVERKEEGEQEITLTSKDGRKFTIKRKFAEESGLLKDMLEEIDEEEDGDVPSIPVPNIHSRVLGTIIELLKKSYEYSDKESEAKKKSLVEYICNKLSLNINELAECLQGVNYLNAAPSLKALAHVIAKWANEKEDYKITKKILEKLPTELLFEIQAEWILQFGTHPVELFKQKIIKDLKTSGNYVEFINNFKNGQFTGLYYDENDQIGLGNSIEISNYIKEFEGFYYFAYLNDDKVIVQNAQTGKEKTFKVENDVISSFEFSPDGMKLAAKTVIHQVVVWDIKSGKQISLKLDDKNVWATSFKFSPDGKKMAIDYGTRLIVFDMQTGNQLTTLEFKRGISFYLLSLEGEKLLTFSQGVLTVWNIKTGNVSVLQTFKFEGRVFPCRFSPDEKRLVVLEMTSVNGNKIVVCDIQTGNKLPFEAKDKAWIESFEFSPDGKKLAIQSRNEIEVRDIQTGEELKTFRPKGEISSCIFGSDWKTVAASFGNKVMVWNTETGSRQKNINIKGLLGLFSLHKKKLFATSKNEITTKDETKDRYTIEIWDRQKSNRLRTFEYDFFSSSWRVSPDKNKLAMKKDNEIVIWDIAKKDSKKRTFNTQNSNEQFKFSPFAKEL